MANVRQLSSLLALFLFPLVSGCGDSGTNPDSQDNTLPKEGMAELNVQDPLRHSYDFIRAGYNGIVQENEVRNAGQHINYNTYTPGAFTVGIQGGEAGTIVDLGHDDSLAARFGVVQTVGGGQGFAHLQLTGEETTNLPEADMIFSVDPFSQTEGHHSVAVHLHHVYLLRIRDRHSDPDLIVKLLPVYLEEGKRVTFQWVRLR